VTPANPILDLLSAPLPDDWTIERLAEQVLSTISSHRPEGGHNDELILDADAIGDRQSQRLLRPLLACLAGMSAAEAGTSPDLYQGHLRFRRQGPEGLSWIVGEFESSQRRVHLRLRRGNSPPTSDEATATPLRVAHADPYLGDPPMIQKS
jgi:hypothetical protein